MTDTTKKTSTPAEIAQRSLDAAKKRVAKADEAIKKAEKELAAAKAERVEAVAVRDYRALHPALPQTHVPASTTLRSGEVQIP